MLMQRLSLITLLFPTSPPLSQWQKKLSHRHLLVSISESYSVTFLILNKLRLCFKLHFPAVKEAPPLALAPFVVWAPDFSPNLILSLSYKSFPPFLIFIIIFSKMASYEWMSWARSSLSKWIQIQKAISTSYLKVLESKIFLTSEKFFSKSSLSSL